MVRRKLYHSKAERQAANRAKSKRSYEKHKEIINARRRGHYHQVNNTSDDDQDNNSGVDDNRIVSGSASERSMNETPEQHAAVDSALRDAQCLSNLLTELLSPTPFEFFDNIALSMIACGGGRPGLLRCQHLLEPIQEAFTMMRNTTKGLRYSTCEEHKRLRDIQDYFDEMEATRDSDEKDMNIHFAYKRSASTRLVSWYIKKGQLYVHELEGLDVVFRTGLKTLKVDSRRWSALEIAFKAAEGDSSPSWDKERDPHWDPSDWENASFLRLPPQSPLDRPLLHPEEYIQDEFIKKMASRKHKSQFRFTKPSANLALSQLTSDQLDCLYISVPRYFNLESQNLLRLFIKDFTKHWLNTWPIPLDLGQGPACLPLSGWLLVHAQEAYMGYMMRTFKIVMLALYRHITYWWAQYSDEEKLEMLVEDQEELDEIMMERRSIRENELEENQVIDLLLLESPGSRTQKKIWKRNSLSGYLQMLSPGLSPEQFQKMWRIPKSLLEKILMECARTFHEHSMPHCVSSHSIRIFSLTLTPPPSTGLTVEAKSAYPISFQTSSTAISLWLKLLVSMSHQGVFVLGSIPPDCEMVCKANRQMKWRIVNSPAQAFAEWDSQCFLTRCDHLVAGGLPMARVSTQSSATIPPAPPSTPVEAIASSSSASVSAAPSTPLKSLSKSISKSPSKSPTKMVGSPSKGKGVTSTTFYALRSPGKKGIFNNRDDAHQALETAGPSASLVYTESLQAASSFLEENEVDNIDDFTGEVDQTDL
ncbi:hypothetical protein C8J56DRAFT_893107 [Mycena floridula]|nr:hypothetical protein C8J56DRAFT_893107 [Mycena floridula]